ncbi:flagellar FliL protein [Oceanospirillum multiglobuliferum]|uniref:flagellar basal body-associated FliL family protein n=1 Tax=Oceanospirillum multiglobuliferum TaxID=64969 RepID=UPI000999D54E|nr:flagellar basal body-associated FliL family protein [Oceanospirillum multiglobuliferum]SKA01498.1 flagellar FliL protein [Oceanospirillum multiglobuliferum]
MIKLVKHCLLALVLITGMGSQAFAEEANSSGDLLYTAIEPAFVLNYGGPGRLKYLKAGITLVTASPLAAQTVNHHMPLIRNEIVSLLSRQTDDAVTSPVGQEQMRIDATQVVKDLFQKEVGHPVIEDLLFTNFIYQK